MGSRLRYGLIGCGGFGRFCFEQYLKLPHLECVAVADLDEALAQRTAAQFGVLACESPSSLLAREDIDIVHLATPPFTHGPLGREALQAGKHVLCEKPLAVSMDEALELAALSKAQGLVLAVNMMMRYNPLCQSVKALIDAGALGQPLHAHFVNDARDEILPPGHWFWDPAKSGGIFIEHGVHFFDLFEWWFGPGEVMAAQQLGRPGSEIIEHVNCTVKYRDSVLVNFYHGFHQANRRDHQEWMIVFENGTLNMREWVPTSLELDFLATRATADTLARLFDRPTLSVEEEFAGEARHFVSRHQAREADARFRLTVPAHVAKPDLYGNMVRALLEDQLTAIRMPGHRRLVDETNGVTSLATAVRARQLAEEAGSRSHAA